MDSPEHVAIVGLGPSSLHYIMHCEHRGGRSACFDEVWAINTFGDVIAHDRLFFMDDVVNVMRDIEETDDERLRRKLTNMLKWLKEHPGPVYTSVAHPDFPSLVAYPLEEILNTVGTAYFNNTVAYALVYAIHIKVKRVSFWGCDYSFGEKHEGTGRSCLEFWMGVAAANGIHIHVADDSTLMDACHPERKFYGYERFKLDLAPRPDSSIMLTMTPRSDVVASVDLENR